MTLDAVLAFMDLWLKIKGRRVVTSLYAKPLALHLYLPPHLWDAPGLLTGLIFGNVLRIHQLCSAATDAKKELKLFLHRLLDHGYKLWKITPIFQRAIDNAMAYLKRSTLKRLWMKSRKDIASCWQVFLHLPYHPANPPSKAIQQLWYHLVGTPLGNFPLNKLTNRQGYDVPIDKLAIARHCPPNLANLLSYRKLEHRMGLKVFLFLPSTWHYYAPYFLSRGRPPLAACFSAQKISFILHILLPLQYHIRIGGSKYILGTGSFFMRKQKLSLFWTQLFFLCLETSNRARNCIKFIYYL